MRSMGRTHAKRALLKRGTMRSVRRNRFVLVGVGLSLATAARAASTAHPPGSIPDSTEMASLRELIATRQTVRLVGTFGSLEISKPLIDSVGVRASDFEARARPRPGIWATEQAQARSAPAPVAWREISAVQVGHSMAGRGAIQGLFIGIGLGVGIASASHDRHSADEMAGYRALSTFSWTLVASVVAGTVVGSKRGWRTVYPPSRQAGRSSRHSAGEHRF